MFRKFLIAVLLFVLLEVSLIFVVEGYIGALNTFLLLLLGSFLGIWIVIWQGLSIGRKIFEALGQRRIPEDQLLDGACLIATGCLLAFPGFVSDLMGLLLFLPFMRSRIRKRVKRWLNRKIRGGNVFFASFRNWRL
ncbi:FxsA family protein [Sporolactobacillus sp. THM7-7]|nr:FxsA family protein [Sporolactobacillus sp. THM7-7]